MFMELIQKGGFLKNRINVWKNKQPLINAFIHGRYGLAVRILPSGNRNAKKKKKIKSRTCLFLEYLLYLYFLSKRILLNIIIQ